MNLRETQLEMVNMIADIDKLFKENGIKYTLLGGSVLGAVRHKGFIPWDDDMDIAVWRKDYEKAEILLSQMPKYTYEFSEKHIIPDAPVGHLHLVNEKYPLELSPTIDVFALDNVPTDETNRQKFRFYANIYHACVLRRPPQNRGKMAKIFFSLFFAITPNFIIDKLQNFYKNKVLNFPYNSDEYLGNIFGYWTEKEYFSKDIYENLALLEFEGVKLPVPQNYDFYLKQMYGDYMKLPPEEKRVPKHKEIKI